MTIPVSKEKLAELAAGSSCNKLINNKASKVFQFLGSDYVMSGFSSSHAQGYITVSGFKVKLLSEYDGDLKPMTYSERLSAVNDGLLVRGSYKGQAFKIKGVEYIAIGDQVVFKEIKQKDSATIYEAQPKTTAPAAAKKTAKSIPEPPAQIGDYVLLRTNFYDAESHIQTIETEHEVLGLKTDSNGMFDVVFKNRHWTKDNMATTNLYERRLVPYGAFVKKLPAPADRQFFFTRNNLCLNPNIQLKIENGSANVVRIETMRFGDGWDAKIVYGNIPSYIDGDICRNNYPDEIIGLNEQLSALHGSLIEKLKHATDAQVKTDLLRTLKIVSAKSIEVSGILSEQNREALAPTVMETPNEKIVKQREQLKMFPESEIKPIAAEKRKNYVGHKNIEGVFQKIINEIPRFDVFHELCAGSAAIAKKLMNVHEAQSKTATGSGITFHLNDIATEVVANLRMEFPKAQISNENTIEWIRNFMTDGKRHAVFLDPPYMMDTKAGKLYEYEMTDDDHVQLLSAAVFKSHELKFLIIHPECELYNRMLVGWRKKEIKIRYSNKTSIECLYMNFPEAEELHTHKYLGTDRHDRQRIKRKGDRWINKLLTMPALEKNYIIDRIKEMNNQNI